MTMKLTLVRCIVVSFVFSSLAAFGSATNAGTTDAALVAREEGAFWNRYLENNRSIPPTAAPKVDCLVDVTGDCVTENGTPCQNLQAGFGVCTGSNVVLESLIYTLIITNVGMVEMDVKVADVTLNGVTSSVLDSVRPQTILPNQATSLDHTIEVNVCEEANYSSVITVEASPPNGNSCQDMEKIDFIILPPPRPTPSPRTPETGK